jgi:hypothetical protein
VGELGEIDGVDEAAEDGGAGWAAVAPEGELACGAATAAGRLSPPAEAA